MCVRVCVFHSKPDPTRILQGPTDMEIIVGESIVLPCQVASDPVLDVSFSWAFNGHLIARGDGHFEFVGGVSDPTPWFFSKCEWAVGASLPSFIIFSPASWTWHCSISWRARRWLIFTECGTNLCFCSFFLELCRSFLEAGCVSSFKPSKCTFVNEHEVFSVKNMLPT